MTNEQIFWKFFERLEQANKSASLRELLEQTQSHMKDYFSIIDGYPLSSVKGTAKMPSKGHVGRKGKKVIVDGKTFSSLSEASKALGICYVTIANRCKSPKFSNYSFAVEKSDKPNSLVLAALGGKELGW